jgi:DNA-directed RNA polymerase specialized sigma24 family protein
VIAESIEPSQSNLVETGHDSSMLGFEDIYACEHDRLVRLAALMLGSTAVAEDVVQEAFAKLYGRLNRVDAPSAWLRTVVVNACRNEHRRWWSPGGTLISWRLTRSSKMPRCTS